MKIFKKLMALVFTFALTISLIPSSTFTYGAGHTHTAACYPGGLSGSVGLHSHWGNTDGIYRSASSDYTETHGCYTAYYHASYWHSDWDDCNNCDGRGYNYDTCSDCSGRGYITCPTCNGSEKVKCDTCNGSGKVTGDVKCTKCSGSGTMSGKVECDSCHGSGTKTETVPASSTSCGTCGGDGYASGCPACGGSGSRDKCGCSGSPSPSSRNPSVCSVCDESIDSVDCSVCSGKGRVGTCRKCGGSGKVTTAASTKEVQCSSCKGKGKVDGSVTCDKCNGSKTISGEVDCKNCSGGYNDCGSCSDGTVDCTNCSDGISGTTTCYKCRGSGDYDYGWTVPASISYSPNPVCGKAVGNWANGQVRQKTGSRYDGALVACVCDKVATNLAPADTVQYLEIGESPNFTGTVTFLNGSTGTGISASGYVNPVTNSSKYNTVQTVTLSAGEYHFNADTTGPLTTTISVYVNGYRRVNTSVNNSLYGSMTVSGTSGNGKSYTCDGITHRFDGLWQAGRSTTITATPYTGYKLLTITDTYGNVVINCGDGSTSAKTYTFTMPNGDASFYAVFAPVTVTTTFKLDGGNINGNTSSFTKTYNYGSAYGSLTQPVKEGYIFNGWLSSKTDTIVSTYDSVPYTNHTLTATWLPVTGTTYSIAYDDYYINPAVLNKTGYTPYNADSVNEWVMTELYGNGNPYVSPLYCAVCHERITNLITSTPEVRMVVPYSHSVYKAWTPNTYTVTFDANGGTLTSAVSSITDASSFTHSAGRYTPTGHAVLVNSFKATKVVMYDMKYGTLPTPNAPAGKYFYGWGTSKDIAHAGIIKSDSLVKLAGNQTLYALYTDAPSAPPTETRKDMTITYDPNGGTGSYKDTFLDVK